MSQMGQTRTFGPFRLMSAMPAKADSQETLNKVRYVPIADIPGPFASRPDRDSLTTELPAGCAEGPNSAAAPVPLAGGHGIELTLEVRPAFAVGEFACR
jgi:hypothetical protein